MILALRKSSPTLLGPIMILVFARRSFRTGRAITTLNAVAARPVAILLPKSRPRQWPQRWNFGRRVIQLRRFGWFKDRQLRNGGFWIGGFRFLHIWCWNDGSFDGVGDWLSGLSNDWFGNRVARRFRGRFYGKDPNRAVVGGRSLFGRLAGTPSHTAASRLRFCFLRRLQLLFSGQDYSSGISCVP